MNGTSVNEHFLISSSFAFPSTNPVPTAWFLYLAFVLPIRSLFAVVIIGAKLLIDFAAARNKQFNVLNLLFLVTYIYTV